MMKNNWFLSLLLLVLLCPAFSLQAQNAADEKAILAMNKAAFDAFNAFDADRFAQVFTETATLINPLGGLIEGREKIQQTHKALFKMWGGDPKGFGYSWENQHVRFLSPEVAVVNIGSSNMRNDTVSDRATYSLTVVKKNGQWLCENLQITPIVAIPGSSQH